MSSKLVRDLIPDIQRREGLNPIVTVDRSLGPLLAKLREEIAELEVAPDRESQVEELADLFEVLQQTGNLLLGETARFEVAHQADRKRHTKGSFTQGYILHIPEPDNDPENPPLHVATQRLIDCAGFAADITRLSGLFLARGYHVSDPDLALAYENYSEWESGVGWLDLTAEIARKGEDYIFAWLKSGMEVQA